MALSANDLSVKVDQELLKEQAVEKAMELIALCQRGGFDIEKLLKGAYGRMQMESKQAAENLKNVKAIEIVSRLYPEYAGDESFLEFVRRFLIYEKDLATVTPESFAAKYPREKFLEEYSKFVSIPVLD